MTFSSKDFNRTRSDFDVVLPEKIIHKNVCESGENQQFNEERQHPVHIVDVDSKTMSMTIGKLLVDQKTNKHRHSYETIIYIQQGVGRSIIEDKTIEWQAGDAIYVPVWAWHSHHNLGSQECIYIACENTPLLQNLGVALREES
ncbi:cupin domain-containing protein [Aliikangiella marina]|uniref:Cupin domain-containing protein n=1 Tax=Aliikangiella marina TaxID=1712262 RepID=A0A545TDU3_9GAMM|nr:cupin domain-containing protein [Aliikangiella marina]TQV75370.1 cupin domain-containing protein [Aliikangiella marina]